MKVEGHSSSFEISKGTGVFIGKGGVLGPCFKGVLILIDGQTGHPQPQTQHGIGIGLSSKSFVFLERSVRNLQKGDGKSIGHCKYRYPILYYLLDM